MVITNIAEMAMFYIKLTIHKGFSIEEGAIGQFKQGLDSDSPLSVTNIAEMAMFYMKLTGLNDFPLKEGPISPNGQFKQSLDSL